MRKVLSLTVALGLIAILLMGVKELPTFGTNNISTYNDVSKYYIKNAMKDTGATNIVTGVILDYRAFDTFVESSVLFTSAMAVMLILKKETK